MPLSRECRFELLDLVPQIRNPKDALALPNGRCHPVNMAAGAAENNIERGENELLAAG